VEKIEHIRIAVKDLDASNLIFEKLLARRPTSEEVESEGVSTSFLKADQIK
jgi:methylmalonyl-CoA/ethylmalonyl-CoA epimerase